MEFLSVVELFTDRGREKKRELTLLTTPSDIGRDQTINEQDLYLFHHSSCY